MMPLASRGLRNFFNFYHIRSRFHRFLRYSRQGFSDKKHAKLQSKFHHLRNS